MKQEIINEHQASALQIHFQRFSPLTDLILWNLSDIAPPAPWSKASDSLTPGSRPDPDVRLLLSITDELLVGTLVGTIMNFLVDGWPERCCRRTLSEFIAPPLSSGKLVIFRIFRFSIIVLFFWPHRSWFQWFCNNFTSTPALPPSEPITTIICIQC